ANEFVQSGTVQVSGNFQSSHHGSPFLLKTSDDLLYMICSGVPFV
ncbi:hypothetical protein A2U01_0111558, partial [Trifolium medium]|nr:hypothetical protein [Trifolium medium]